MNAQAAASANAASVTQTRSDGRLIGASTRRYAPEIRPRNERRAPAGALRGQRVEPLLAALVQLHEHPRPSDLRAGHLDAIADFDPVRLPVADRAGLRGTAVGRLDRDRRWTTARRPGRAPSGTRSAAACRTARQSARFTSSPALAPVPVPNWPLRPPAGVNVPDRLPIRRPSRWPAEPLSQPSSLPSAMHGAEPRMRPVVGGADDEAAVGPAELLRRVVDARRGAARADRRGRRSSSWPCRCSGRA